MLKSELENAHDRALSVRWTLVQRRPERSEEVASQVYVHRLAGIHRRGGDADDGL